MCSQAEDVPEWLQQQEKPECYEKAECYWSQVSADDDGMLGGFSRLSAIDIEESKQFLRVIRETCHTEFSHALDCGAGIGRVTLGTLLPVFDRVDMVDVTAAFIQQSEQYIGVEQGERVHRKFVCGLQDFTPEPNRYDVIWIQFVCGNLNDADFVRFLRRCKAALRVHGCLVVKDNVCRREQGVFHEDDHSRTRHSEHFRRLFHEAQCDVVCEAVQGDWPMFVFPVHMWALQ